MALYNYTTGGSLHKVLMNAAQDVKADEIDIKTSYLDKKTGKEVDYKAPRMSLISHGSYIPEKIGEVTIGKKTYSVVTKIVLDLVDDGGVGETKSAGVRSI